MKNSTLVKILFAKKFGRTMLSIANSYTHLLTTPNAKQTQNTHMISQSLNITYHISVPYKAKISNLYTEYQHCALKIS